MTYCSVNAKVLAMNETSKGDVIQDAARLKHFIHSRPVRKFVEFMVLGLASGEMDVAYYLGLWKHILMLDKLSRGVMRRIVGTEIDLQNILWMYRLKRFYGVAGDSTFGYLIPVGNRLSKETITHMANCKNVGELINVLAQSPYGGVFGDFSHGEKRLFDAVSKAYKRESRQNLNSIATVCGYLYDVGTRERVPRRMDAAERSRV